MWGRKQELTMDRFNAFETQYLASLNDLQAGLRLAPTHDICQQLRMVDLTEEDLRRIAGLKPIIVEHLDSITDAFYSTILIVGHLKETIERYSSLNRLKQTLSQHIAEMFSGIIDDSFVEKRYRISHAHVRIGLEPKWYIGAFQNLQKRILTVVMSHFTNQELQISVVTAITKLMNIEQQIVLDAYEMEKQQMREEQYEKVKRELREHIGAMSSELAALAQQTNVSVEQLVTSSTEISASFEMSMTSSESTQNMASVGIGSIDRLNQMIGNVSESIKQMNGFVSDLKQSLDQMKGITSLVKEIADQTNLLSLNASIEAARAGEHGTGFSIVASEVKKLSDESKQSVGSIQALIESSQTLMNGVVSSLRGINLQIVEGQSESASSNSLFHSIIESMKHNVEELQSNKEDMLALVRVIREIGGATDQVSRSAEKLNTQAAVL